MSSSDLSFATLVLNADLVVQLVMALLAAASLACWTIILDRAVRLVLVRRQARHFADGVAHRRELPVTCGMAGRVQAAGLAAAADQDGTETRAERRDRIERALKSSVTAELRRLHVGLPLLATVGSTAPFVGLFGTVWGIMNSFSAIARSQDTSLAVVAPGIAEALFATAVGLLAAIPAVVAYNKLTTDLGRIQQTFGAAIASLGDRLARDRQHVFLREVAE